MLLALSSLFAGTAFAQTTLVHYKFKFGAATNPTPAGYLRVSPANLYTKAYAADTVVGYYGFQNWQHNRLGVVDRGGSDTLHRDFISNFDSADITPAVFYHNSPFYFSVNVPEGKYRVKVTMGDPADTAVTTIKGETRRLLLKDFVTAPGQYVTKTFSLIRRDPAIKGTTKSVGLDFTNGRENPIICLNWDRKLTLEFNGRRPCISAVEVTQVPDTTGTTIHLCGNSTLVEWENEPWTAWGTMLPAFFDTNVFTNDLASSGLTSSSFLAQLRLAKICSMMNKGDYLIFEFGHNDSKTGGVSTTQFAANMAIYRDSALAHGANMVYVTPTARLADTDSSTSIGGYAQLVRTTAASLNTPFIDLNAAVIHINAAIPTQLYCWVTADSLYPDQPPTQDSTHFIDFGAYTLAKWVAYQGMRNAGIPVRVHLYDTAAVFNASQPLNPAATTDPDTFATWHLACGIDTVYRHPSSTVLATIVTGTKAVAAPVIAGGENPITVNAEAGSVAFTVTESGGAKFIVYSIDGRKIMQMTAVAAPSQKTMKWEALCHLPQGTYFLEMEINGRSRGKVEFQRR
jgi:lysophospholipase L1-like esterase